MKSLVIIGAGGFGREVLNWARQSAAHGREWTVKGFIDDNAKALDEFSADARLIGSIAEYRPAVGDVFVCAMGNVAAKKRCVLALLERGAEFVQVIHPSAVLGAPVKLGRGVILCPHAVVTSHVELGDFVSVNLHSTVAHDARIGPFSQLHCHVDVTGGVQIGAEVLVGSHASILPGMKIGDGALVGAGALVTRDVPAGGVVYGTPARVMPSQSQN